MCSKHFSFSFRRSNFGNAIFCFVSSPPPAPFYRLENTAVVKIPAACVPAIRVGVPTGGARGLLFCPGKEATLQRISVPSERTAGTLAIHGNSSGHR